MATSAGSITYDAGLFADLCRAFARGELSPERSRLTRPPAPLLPSAITQPTQLPLAHQRRLIDRGHQAIAAGHVAALLLNGGMATRFGGAVKGVVPVVPGQPRRSFLAVKLAGLCQVARERGGRVPVAVMHSFATAAASREHLEQIDWSGVPIADRRVFEQSILPRLLPSGAPLHSHPDAPALPLTALYAAPGHGAAGMDATMTTGGYNLTRERAEAMVEAGITSVSVSIDGLEASHDRVRAVPQSWQRAFAALRHLRAAGSKIAVNTQINAYTQTELEALLELIAAEGVHSWQLQLTVPHGNAADHPELIVQPYMFLELFEALDRVLRRAAALRVRIWPANSLGYFGPLEQRLRGHLKQRTGHYDGCDAGSAALGIESDGTLKSCPSLGGPTNIGGSIRERSLWEIWTQAREFRELRERTVEDLWGYCRECYYGPTCLGGCTAVAEPLLGRPGNNPYCHHRALELDRIGLRERVEMVRAAPATGFGTGLFRVVREAKDPAARASTAPVIEGPRVSRAVEGWGPGREIELAVEHARAGGPATGPATGPGEGRA
jgi:radical SAM protein with 4Fe4S-binding SPASM domain